MRNRENVFLLEAAEDSAAQGKGEAADKGVKEALCLQFVLLVSQDLQSPSGEGATHEHALGSI